MFTGGTRAIIKTLEKNGYVEIIEKKVENSGIVQGYFIKRQRCQRRILIRTI